MKKGTGLFFHCEEEEILSLAQNRLGNLILMSLRA